VANFSTSAITVRTFVATFAPTTGSAFLRSNILWNSTTVWSCTLSNPMGSGETVTFTADQATAADATPPLTRVAVDASNVSVPDIVIKGSGTEARIELISFRTTDGSCAAGTARSMVGANFTDVTLRDPSNNIVGQFSFTVP